MKFKGSGSLGKVGNEIKDPIVDPMLRRGDVQAARTTNRGTCAAEFIWNAVHPRSGLPLVPPRLAIGDHDALAALAPPPPPVDKDAWLQDDQHLHAATEWDKYHREVIKLGRTYDDSWYATELREVAVQLYHLFHLGDGSKIMRMVSVKVSLSGCLGYHDVGE